MKNIIRLLLIPAVFAALSACNDVDVLQSVAEKANQPLPQSIVAKMKSEHMSATSPIMMRIFKEEGVLEVWKQKDDGTYGKIAQYEICAWSGKLGPKKEEGDRQAPEGFYLIRPAQMNPQSNYYLSFNIGYPNTYDRSLGRTGSNIMVHGACSSAGCYSMTDENVAQIYAFARDAFRGGQRAFQVEAFPFRMTAENMAKHRDNPNFDFWKMLKVGYDYFQITKRPPAVDVCDRKYVFNKQLLDGGSFVATAACPSMTTPEPLQVAYASYEKKYDKAFEVAVKEQKAKAERETEIAQRKQEMIANRKEAQARAAAREKAAEVATAKFLTPITSLLPKALQPDASAADEAMAAATPAPSTPASAVAGSADAGGVPVPQADPREPAPQPVAASQQANASKKPFWKFW
ncbi:MAG TPA: murein L,D-transpeptidase family protein [Pararhizobium sp.]|nr:murein L,D-transpeptidase family protein [Pararhizobium sp.]